MTQPVGQQPTTALSDVAQYTRPPSRPPQGVSGSPTTMQPYPAEPGPNATSGNGWVMTGLSWIKNQLMKLCFCFKCFRTLPPKKPLTFDDAFEIFKTIPESEGQKILERLVNVPFWVFWSKWVFWNETEYRLGGITTEKSKRESFKRAVQNYIDSKTNPILAWASWAKNRIIRIFFAIFFCFKSPTKNDLKKKPCLSRALNTFWEFTPNKRLEILNKSMKTEMGLFDGCCIPENVHVARILSDPEKQKIFIQSVEN